MEHKSIGTLKNRLKEIEKQHNRLTTLVIALMSNNEKLKKRITALETTGLPTTIASADTKIDNIIQEEKNSSEDRTNQLLEELKKAQLT